MFTECKTKQIKFQGAGRREVVGRFDGGMITSNGGGLLLGEVERRFKIIERFSGCFTDYRNPGFIEHTVKELISQRVHGLALGYEDLNDHDDIRSDHLLAVLCGKKDPTGKDRRHTRDKGKALAGKSTLNRLELSGVDIKGHKKIIADFERIDNCFVDIFLDTYSKEPDRIIIDVDATDDLIHGNQEGRFFHGYYKNYCYLPLYIFCGEQLLSARLRPSNIDAAKGTVEELERIVSAIRKKWKRVEIWLRGDSGFCREDIMTWCEDNSVEYILGLAKNSRLKDIIKEDMVDAEIMYRTTGRASRVYNDFQYQTKKSWYKSRRVISKAEYLSKGANPRFIVTSLSPEAIEAEELYEKVYCARGDMENRIKEQQLYLFADRTSTSEMRSNQLRLYFSSVAYVLLSALRRAGLAGTSMSKAQCHTIRLKLLKIGAKVRVTARKIWVSMTESCPYKEILFKIFKNLTAGLVFT